MNQIIIFVKTPVKRDRSVNQIQIALTNISVVPYQLQLNNVKNFFPLNKESNRQLKGLTYTVNQCMQILNRSVLKLNI